jgi:hypothetical protein
MTMIVKAPKKPGIDERLLEIQEKLDSWNCFIRELKVPGDLAVAFQTGRIELLCLARPRDMAAAEVKVLYDLIGGLLETNAALRQHAQLVAELSQMAYQNMRGLHKALERLGDFANFRDPIEGDEE